MAAAAQELEPVIVSRPSYKDTFKPRQIKDIINDTLRRHLTGKKYDPETTAAQSKAIAADIKSTLKDLKLDRYKFLVQVVLGEMKGAGVRMGCRCFWDSQTDKMAEETFINDSLFCSAVAFGVYLY